LEKEQTGNKVEMTPEKQSEEQRRNKNIAELLPN
jgi:hypothetical protein